MSAPSSFAPVAVLGAYEWALADFVALLGTLEATLEDTLIALVIEPATSPAASDDLIGHDVRRFLLSAEKASFRLRSSSLLCHPGLRVANQVLREGRTHRLERRTLLLVADLVWIDVIEE